MIDKCGRLEIGILASVHSMCLYKELSTSLHCVRWMYSPKVNMHSTRKGPLRGIFLTIDILAYGIVWTRHYHDWLIKVAKRPLHSRQWITYIHKVAWQFFSFSINEKMQIRFLTNGRAKSPDSGIHSPRLSNSTIILDLTTLPTP